MKKNEKIEKGLELMANCFGGEFDFIESKDYDRELLDDSKYLVTIKKTNLFEIGGKYGQYFLGFDTLKDFYNYIKELENVGK